MFPSHSLQHNHSNIDWSTLTLIWFPWSFKSRVLARLSVCFLIIIVRPLEAQTLASRHALENSRYYGYSVCHILSSDDLNFFCTVPRLSQHNYLCVLCKIGVDQNRVEQHWIIFILLARDACTTIFGRNSPCLRLVFFRDCSNGGLEDPGLKIMVNFFSQARQARSLATWFEDHSVSYSYWCELVPCGWNLSFRCLL